MRGHLSQWELDALALRALPPEATTEAEAHLEACTRCQQARASLQATHRHFETDVLPRTLPRLRARREGTPPRPRWVWLLAPAAALGVALAVLPHWRSSSPEPLPPEYSIKGGPLLRVFARQGERVEEAHEGAVLSPGDALRFVVEPAGLPYLLVVSLDGSGGVSVYFPYGGVRSERLSQAAGPVELPGSIVLDAAPGPERVFALFSRVPLERTDVEEVLRALAARGPRALRETRRLPVPADGQASFLLEKP
ncbi:DUF4384 domain-containing protein [Pyxidicoccus caerfyrddinensis]|uniref:DUF4384 domain-containing protein n=1 Tax=Pyxidicoccus caerfyrddinensis TaxID=2709663 RepID=UPI0013DD0847|nr:DUF4384 domain-containing protein [Pyxidicoccus caerfyrddinensis]